MNLSIYPKLKRKKISKKLQEVISRKVRKQIVAEKKVARKWNQNLMFLTVEDCSSYSYVVLLGKNKKKVFPTDR